MAIPLYATVEAVRDALEEKASAYDTAQILRALRNATDDVDDVAQLAAYSFRPALEIRYFRWPPEQTTSYYRLWLDANRLLSVVTLGSGSSVIASGDFFLEPNEYGPPYNRIEIDLSGPSAFSTGSGTFQRSITVYGWWGVSDDQTDVATLSGTINSSVTTLAVSNGAGIGIGDVLIIDSERFNVTGATWITTSQTILADLSASAAGQSILVSDGTAFGVDEFLTVDAERMRIRDIIGNTLVVSRAVDGSTLAAHTTGATLYARRSLSIERGAYGSTAAAHTSGASVLRHDVPGAVAALAVASAVSTLLAERRGYAGSAGPGTGAAPKMEPGSLDELRERVSNTYGRPVRTRVI